MSGQAAPLETEQDFAAASGGSESVVVAEGTIEQKQEQDSPSAMQPVADSGGQQQHRETVASGKQGDTGADVAVAREDSNVDAKPSAPPEKTESTTPAGKPAAEVPSERRAEGSISGGDAESRPAQKHEAPSASPTRQDGAGSQDRNDNDAVKQRRDEGAGSVRSPRKNEETKQEALEETSKKVAGGGDVQDELPKTNVGDQEKIAATPAKPDVKPKESHVTGEGGPAKDEGASAGKEAPDTPKSGEGDSSADGKVQASDEDAASPPSKGAAGGEGARQQQQQPTSAPSSPKKKKKKAKKKKRKAPPSNNESIGTDAAAPSPGDSGNSAPNEGAAEDDKAVMIGEGEKGCDAPSDKAVASAPKDPKDDVASSSPSPHSKDKEASVAHEKTSGAAAERGAEEEPPTAQEKAGAAAAEKGSERSSEKGSKAKGKDEKIIPSNNAPPAPSAATSKAKGKASEGETKKADGKGKPEPGTKSNQQQQKPPSPKKKDVPPPPSPSAQEGKNDQTANSEGGGGGGGNTEADADDGAWETVEVKPRGRRGKGGGGGNKKASSSGTGAGGASGEPQGSISNGKSLNVNNNGGSGSSGSNNNNNGKNSHSHDQGVSTSGGGHGNNTSSIHGSSDGNSSHHGNNSRKRNGRNRRDRNSTRGGSNQQQDVPSAVSSHHQHQSSSHGNTRNTHSIRMAKEVITHILNAVDEEVGRRGKLGHGGGRPFEEGGKQRNRSNSAHDKRSSMAAGGRQQHSNQQQKKQSKVGAVATAAGGSGHAAATAHPPASASMAPSSSAKSLRDVLMGASSAPQNSIPGKGQQPGGSQNKTTGGGGGNVEQTKGSSTSAKVKPGLSFKSVIDPDAANKPPTQQQGQTKQAQQQQQPPKPKPNAWAKPPSDIKAKLAPAASDTKKGVNSRAQQQQEKPTGEKGMVSSKPTKISGSGVAGSGLVPPSNNTATPNEDGKEKNVVANAPANNGEAQPTAAASVTDEASAFPPPLSTLLGPGNSCSGSSSVASSLEAPHAANTRFNRHHHHQSSSSVSAEDDVGYHLLNVCGQLSEEIDTFMSRRALALDIRRKERSAVLSALGDTLGKIWPGQCRVEMYGSCATQLDLPSSDLDLVVCGLDDMVVDHMIPAPPLVDQETSMSSLHNTSSSSLPEKGDVPQEYASPIQQQHPQTPMTPVIDHQQLGSFGGGDSMHECGGSSYNGQTSPDKLATTGSMAEGDQSGTMLDESAEGMMGIDYSPAASAAENYSNAEYNDSSQHDQMAMDQVYSPGYSYHSQQDMAAENYTPGGYQGEENMGNMEGYGQEYQHTGQEFYYASPYSYVSSLSLNAQRVLRLASELELQPWAVQVKAIPTATVPVVKMLADPSKIPGLASSGGSWMMQQHMVAQSRVSAGGTQPPISAEQMSPQNQQGTGFFSPSQMAQQWRGADIMNGLQPVDITFEGPEHGGIGSTTYSARVVQEACDETGLDPESTPVVQVASVLKELLAQRRLNEPFSGGLSSYGLLLLLLAVLKDRKIIQEEMKKMERQRQKVTGEANRPTHKHLVSRKNDGVADSPSPGVESTEGSATPSAASRPTISSSWASIAKKSNGSTARTDSLSTVTKSTGESAATAKAGGVNYSQVVQKESNERTKNVIEEHGNDGTTSGKKQTIDASINDESNATEKKKILPQSSNVAIDGPAVLSQVTPSSADDTSKLLGSSSVPQGSNDVLEVLCSGELTSGKLLMHFLLFYGQHFDARTTLIDINGTHHPEYGMVDFDRLSPFVNRPFGGTIDPITGMYSVDPIVVYDPLEGAMDHNVSKRCYCWNNVKWVFAQCYMTVSSIVETSDTRCTKSSSLQSKQHDKGAPLKVEGRSSGDAKSKGNTESGAGDVMSPILELLLSF